MRRFFSMRSNAQRALQQFVLACLAPSQSFALMNQRFFRLLLFAVQTQQTVSCLRRRHAQRFDSRLCVCDLCRPRRCPCRKFLYTRRQARRFFLQHRHGLLLRSASRLPFARLRAHLIHVRAQLPAPRGKLFRPLRAIRFQRRQIQLILVLPDFCIQLVHTLIQPVLLAFLLLNGRRMLQFRRRKLFESFRNPRSFAFHLSRFARQHLSHDPAHLLTNFRISPRLGRLPLQRTELLFNFHHNVIHARKIQF